MKRSEQPWIPALLVAVAVVLVLVFVFGRRNGSSDDAGGGDQPKTEQSGSGNTGDGGDGGGSEGGAPEAPAAPKSEWPAEMKWKPEMLGDREEGFEALSPEAPAGLYLWTDFQGWFVWVVDPAGKAGARGTITTNSEFGSAELVEGGTGEFVREDSVLRFDFSGIGQRASGFRFNQGFFTSEVRIDLEGEDLPVFIGHEPTILPPPFVLEKTVPEG